MDQNNLKYPRGIELVSGAIIENNEREILMTQSPQWGNKWIVPGGHIEPDERIISAAVREGEEETGLKLKGVSIFYWGELIGSKDFHRPAHFVFFDIYCQKIGGKLKLDQKELIAFKWILPEEALKMDLAESYIETIKKFIEYRKFYERRI